MNLPFTMNRYTTQHPHYSGPIQWARGNCTLKRSVAARPCTLANCEWRAAAPGLKPLRLPRVRFISSQKHGKRKALEMIPKASWTSNTVLSTTSITTWCFWWGLAKSTHRCFVTAREGGGGREGVREGGRTRAKKRAREREYVRISMASTATGAIWGIEAT